MAKRWFKSQVFNVVCEEFLGGNGKAEEPKLQGAGIPPKPWPNGRSGMGMKE